MPADPSPLSLDSLIPPEVAEKAEELGVKKAKMDVLSLMLLAILAGAFIALGALFYTTVVTGTAAHAGYGISKLLGGIAFCLGLVLVVIAGAELFTGNNLLFMATLGRRLSVAQLLRNWTLVYIGNFIGSVFTAWLILLTAYHLGGGGQVGLTALSTGEAKCSLEMVPALFRGIYCNALVCLAVWLTYSCRTTGDKILAIIFPITAFVAAGFEHSVANMYFVPYALFVKQAAGDSYWSSIGQQATDFPNLTWGNFLWNNLLPVTIGNIIGGAIFVGLAYWLIYQRYERNRLPKPAPSDPDSRN